MINTIIGFYLGIAVCLLKSGIEDVAEGTRYIRRKKALEANISDHNENIRLYGAYMTAEDAKKEKAELERLRAELAELDAQ